MREGQGKEGGRAGRKKRGREGRKASLDGTKASLDGTLVTFEVGSHGYLSLPLDEAATVLML